MSERPRWNRAPIDGRLAELLADRAVWGLSGEEAAEVAAAGLAGEASFDLAAAALHMAFAAGEPAAEMPPALRARIEADAAARFAGPVLASLAPSRTARAPWLPWAVAACAVFASVAAWWPRGAPLASPATDPAAMRQQALAAGAGVWAWADFKHPVTQEDPEVRGVRGDVVWNERDQRGFMRIAGLPKNDPKTERYQLWIIDERGLQQRVNGGVFDIAGSGEVVLPFKPDLPIRNAAIFAVTIEKPEGVVVSDMSRRACAAVAAKPRG